MKMDAGCIHLQTSQLISAMAVTLQPPPGLTAEPATILALYQDLAAGSIKQQTATWVLHDTPDGRLGAAGYGLIRSERRVRLATWDQFARGEAEAECTWRRRELPAQVTGWPAGALRDRVAELTSPRAVVPRVRWELTWIQAAVMSETGAIILRLTAWLVTPETGPTRMWLIVTEEPGAAKACRAPRRRIRACGWHPAAAAPLPTLAGPDVRPSVAAAADFTVGSMPSGQAMRECLRRTCARLPILEGGVIADLDPEFLHQHRVTLRRLRSLTRQFIGVFAPQAANRIREIITNWARCSGRLRDLDVWLEAHAEHATQVPASLRAGLEPLFTQIAIDRAVAQADLAAEFASPSHRAEQAELATLLATAEPGPEAEVPVAILACRRTWKAYRKVAEEGSLIGVDTPAEAVHQVRIRCKKLRYLLDACGDLTAPGIAGELREELRAVQGVLGSFNDAAVQIAALRERMVDGQQTVDTLLAVGALIAALERERDELRARVIQGMQTIAGPATRTRYRRAFRTTSEL
jgi:CHAD domain-containing protein